MITQEQIREKLAQEIKYSGLSQTKSMPSIETFANLCYILDSDSNEILCLNEKTKNNSVVYKNSTHNGNNNF